MYPTGLLCSKKAQNMKHSANGQMFPISKFGDGRELLKEIYTESWEDWVQLIHLLMCECIYSPNKHELCPRPSAKHRG